MDTKVLGEAPAMPMGNIYQIWRDYLKDVRTQESPQDLFDDLLNLDGHGSPKSRGDDAMFASAPPESFDWTDAGGSGDGHGGRGGNGGHHGGAHEGHDGGSLTAALSLFNGFGHGDLDF